MGNMGLLIGNGFTIDFATKLGLNPSEPFSHFNTDQITYNHFINYIPAIKNELFKLAHTEQNDYAAIETFMKSKQYNTDKDSQLRRFLAISYSIFQMKAENQHIHDWKWTKWFHQNKDKLELAISFNYELLLETALKAAGIPHYRTGTTEPEQGIPVIKPHGSIDFDIVDEPATITRWNEPTRLHDTGHVHTVPKSEWLDPRMEADIIPPRKNNYQRSLRWVKEGIRTFKSRASRIDTFIIVGLSYSLADREEVDQYLDCLHEDTRVIVVDPQPSEDLLRKIVSLRLKLITPRTTSGLPW
ncbi:hypothetical protein ACERII_16410 [Evansella sp. AB-rgal1]|uniref:hypothetical protein n=1 Tax=Evansella sp. AB-rgal1 TaxID=3242696 RepID=UPI00359E791B